MCSCSHACAAASLVISGECEYAKKFLGLVAELCDACAEECEKHQHMEHCKLCAQTCRTCADECRKMAR